MLTVIPLIAAPILLAIALAVRFAGNAHVLNIVNYSQVSNVAALHRWAGNRLLILPLISAVIGILCFRSPTLALPLLIVFIAAVFGVAIWLAVGSAKFHNAS